MLQLSFACTCMLLPHSSYTAGREEAGGPQAGRQAGFDVLFAFLLQKVGFAFVF